MREFPKIMILSLAVVISVASVQAQAADGKWKSQAAPGVVLDQYNVPTAVMYDGKVYNVAGQGISSDNLADIAPASGLSEDKEELSGNKPHIVEVTDDTYFE